MRPTSVALPVAVQPGDRAHVGAQAGVVVEQFALRGRVQQRLVGVLAMDVDQQFAERAQQRLAFRYRDTEVARTTGQIRMMQQQMKRI